jgi:hypothetical protein
MPKGFNTEQLGFLDFKVSPAFCTTQSQMALNTKQRALCTTNYLGLSPTYRRNQTDTPTYRHLDAALLQ